MRPLGKEELIDVLVNAPYKENFWAALVLASATVALTAILEWWSWDTVRLLRKQGSGGNDLYRRALIANVRNHFLLGTPTYTFAAGVLCVPRSREGNHIFHLAISVVTVLLCHAVMYYAIHRAFHENSFLYRYHKFHHRFHSYVPPSSANAVSSVEYLVAYVFPFAITCAVFSIDVASLKIGVLIISVANLLVHTPKLEDISKRILPSWIVTTHDHLEHHRKLQAHYASPTLNVDTLVEWLSFKPQA